MRRAAALGDGWMPYLYSPQRYAASRATIEEIAALEGRDLTGFEWMSFAFVHVDADGGRARRDAAAILGTRYGRDMTDLLDRVAVVGDPDDVAGQLDELVAAGARHLVLAPLHGGERIEVAEELLAITRPRVG
jgi:alkanesulfonate monooxygenase SsuD/methylene tetrahydromethanopterin reductase-like flavin-dependent oxidoreductase (luciferase family)